MRIFGSIEQFRHAVDKVNHRATYIGQSEDDKPMYDDTKSKPVLEFTGTVKLHGTNSGIQFNMIDGSTLAMSHERVLSTEADNHGFCTWAQSESGLFQLRELRKIIDHFLDDASPQYIYVYGEWCGSGINGKTAIGKLSNRFFVFSIMLKFTDGCEKWLELSDIASAWQVRTDLFNDDPFEIYFVHNFKTYQVSIDFNDPGSSIDELERLTLEVEAACPIGSAFDIEGIGEGIVWTCMHPTFGHLMFKTKGSKHKGTKNKQLVAVAPEVMKSRQDFVDAVLTESRLEQGFDLMKATYGKVTEDRIGDFLAWIGKDVLKEESDTMNVSKLERKFVMGAVNNAAKKWLMPRLDKF